MTSSGRDTSAIIVGGAGSMGRWAVRAIARLASVERLVVADLDLDRAKLICREIGDPCVAVQLDATDGNGMRELFRDCDVVLNTMGPFSLFARAIVTAAIDAGCHYLDIDDDWQSTVEAEEYDEAARRAGRAIIKGIGGSPGISNLLAVVAGQRLDSVESIVTGWSMRGAVLEEEPAYPVNAQAGAATEHWILQVTGAIRGWRKGAPADTSPLAPVDLDYPGLGLVRAYTVGHPEAVTLPGYFPSVRTALNVTSGPDWLFDFTREIAAAYGAGELTLAEAAHRFENAPRPTSHDARDPLGQVWAAAYGTRAGQRLGVSVAPSVALPGKMGGSTGTALAIGLELFLRNPRPTPGVSFPEQAFDPTEFFESMALLAVPQVAADEFLVINELDDALSPTFVTST